LYYNCGLLFYRYSYKKTNADITFSFGIGICYLENLDECFVYIPLLEKAVFVFPTIGPDGKLEVKPCK
jgi:hypothetical protein